MPKYNIWVRRDFVERLDAEENKSGLINDLLDKHYNTVVMIDPKEYSQTCKAGHPSKDGKHCSNLKCAYYL